MQVRFRQEFNELGGEDAAFFTELKNVGFTFFVPENLLSFELVDEQRAKYSWFIKKAPS